MARRSGFGTYAKSPGLTDIEIVRKVLERIAGGMKSQKYATSMLCRAGLDRTQAKALVNWSMKRAEEGAKPS